MASGLGMGGAAEAPAKEKNPPAHRQALPKGAFQDLGRSPVGALLGARLASGETATWLEREQVARILKEKELQILFSPQEGARRAVAGQLLKADFLVLLRPVQATPEQKEQKTAQLVVCETRGGLRLCAHTIAFSSNAEADVAALEQLVHEAIRRHGEKVAAVCAVPPFVSHDLTHQYDYLKAAYAKVVEKMLVRQKGVLVAELAEAEALAKETALADPGARLERPAPIFLLGEYRNEGAGEKRRVQVTIRLMRGGKEIGRTSQSDLPPDAVPDLLSRLVKERVAPFLGKDAPQVAAEDVGAEAKQIADRARIFRQLGNWQEALDLLEASLLLRPDQPALHHDAVIALNKLMRQHWHHNITNVPEAALGLAFYRRGLQHLEAFMHKGGDLALFRTTTNSNFLGEYRSYMRGIWAAANPKTPREIRDLVAEVQQEQQAILQRLVSRWTNANKWDECLFLYWALDGLSEPERHALVLRTILQLKDAPGGKGRAMTLALRGYSIQFHDNPGFRQFLKQMAAAPDAEVQAAAQSLGKMLADLPTGKANPGSTATPSPSTISQELQFLPVKVMEEGAPPTKQSLPVMGCLPAGAELDVFWNGRTLYLMRQKGKLKPVWSADDVNFQCTSVAFDGRYVWAAFKNPRQQPILLVLDPETEKVRRVTEAMGLPLAAPADVPKGATQRLLVAALQPGKVCVAGTFGRAWVALATFQPDAGPKAKVIHEAREAPDPEDKEQWQRSTVAFTPSYIFTLTDGQPGEKGRQQVLLGRSSPNHLVMTHPLLIDPDNLSVKVMSDYILGETIAQQFDAYKGAVFLLEARKDKIELARIGFPALAKEVVLRDIPEGFLVYHGDRVHVIGKRWWTASLAESKFHTAAAEVPWHYRNRFGPANPEDSRPLAKDARKLVAVCRSSHYGLLLFARGNLGDWSIHQVEFPLLPK